MLLLYVLILFQIKHFLADYIFQTDYHLKKFDESNSYILPLASHCAIHSMITALILLTFSVEIKFIFIFSALDFGSHFIMDRIKASKKYLGRFTPLTAQEYNTCKNINDIRRLKSNRFFYWSLGFDQMIHHLTDLLIIWLAFSERFK